MSSGRLTALQTADSLRCRSMTPSSHFPPSVSRAVVLKPDQPVVEKRLSDYAVDSLVRGYVKHTDSKGCFVWLTRDIVGRVLIKDVRQQQQTGSRQRSS
jgi:hypothetical protein